MNLPTQANQTKVAPQRAGALLFEPTSQISSARDIAELIFKHIGFASAVFGLVMILSVGFAYLQPPTYESTSRVLVERGKRPTQRSDTIEYPLEAFEALTSEIEIITSRTVAEDVVDRLGLVDRPVRDTFVRRVSEEFKDALDRLGLLTRLNRRESLVRSVQQGLRVEPVPQSSVLTITYSAESPADAAEIARAVTDSYLAQHQKIFRADTAVFFERRVEEIGKELTDVRERLRRETNQPRSQSLLLELGVLEKAYTSYRDRLNTARSEMVADESLINLRIIDYPVVPGRPARSRMFLLTLALAGGVLLSVSLALLREYFDHNIYSAREIEEYLDLPVLGSITYVAGGLAGPRLGVASGMSPSQRSRQPLSS